MEIIFERILTRCSVIPVQLLFLANFLVSQSKFGPCNQLYYFHTHMEWGIRSLVHSDHQYLLIKIRLKFMSSKLSILSYTSIVDFTIFYLLLLGTICLIYRQHIEETKVSKVGGPCSADSSCDGSAVYGTSQNVTAIFQTTYCNGTICECNSAELYIAIVDANAPYRCARDQNEFCEDDVQCFSNCNAQNKCVGNAAKNPRKIVNEKKVKVTHKFSNFFILPIFCYKKNSPQKNYFFLTHCQNIPSIQLKWKKISNRSTLYFRLLLHYQFIGYPQIKHCYPHNYY
ncbi:hypothetical protein BpHYR1_054234 [Brachionus plicatilis]|uniref:Uncharacterized protein n=1 Tax=Brachionus plicatilis TaxID=10195 RepID=A0A3M7SS03_BRAPC|nr:hypothetical protein BpHYR1_054234 [Brachionus plicatilis]